MMSGSGILLRVDERPERRERDERRRDVDDGTTAEDDGRAGDGTRRRRGHTFHERFHGHVPREAPEVRRGDDDEEVAREEDAEGGGGRPERAGDEIADERGRDDDRPGRNHRHGDRIEKLPVCEPVEAVDDSAVEEWDDGEPASKDEGPCLSEEPPDTPEDVRRRRPVEPGHEPDGREHEGGRATGSPDEQREHAAADEDPHHFRLRPGRDEGGDEEDAPEEAVLRERHLHELPRAPRDDGDDGRADAVERALHPGEPAEAEVERGEREHHDERGSTNANATSVAPSTPARTQPR
jgi:hypothetical protein